MEHCIVGQVKAMMKYGREVRDWEGGSENGGDVSFIRFRWLYPRGVEEPDYMEEI